MALLWIEGFEGFGSSVGVAPSPSGIMGRKYPLINREQFFDVETGRYGKCMELSSSNADYFQTPNLTTNATMIAGMAIKVNSLHTGRLFAFFDGSTLGVGLRLNADGTLSVYRGTSTLLGTTSSQLTTGTWFYIEMKVLVHDSTGTVDVKVNETSWLSLTSQDTKEGSNSYHTACRMGEVGSFVFFDDMYLLDASGSANNDFLGNCRVSALAPGSAGDSTQWTPSAGSNYQCVDDGELLDEDTTYNETSTNGHQDLYHYGNLPSEAATVIGVQIITETRVTSGSVGLSSTIKTGTTTSQGSADTITSTSYVTSFRVEEEDPDTSTAWTVSGVDGAQFGIHATI